MSTAHPRAQRPAHVPNGVTLVSRRVDHPDAVALLRAFHEEQVGRYGFAESVDLDQEIYERPNGLFIVAYQDETPIGCGGYHWLDRSSGTVEIKKTYLAHEKRGHGIGRALLAWLEADASVQGAHRAILETGVFNTAALRLFRNSGYQPMARYVADRDPSINRAFMKTLGSTA